MIQLIVAGQTYNYPQQNDSPPWGSEATDWAIAVTDALTSVIGPYDIAETIATIANNQVAPASVIGLAFNPVTVRGAVVDYTIYRVTTSSGATEQGETGTMYITYLNNANTWNIAVAGGGTAGVSFTMNPAGQVLYTSSNFTGSNYIGTIHFKASAFAQ